MPILIEILIKIAIMLVLMALQKTKKPPAGTIDDTSVPQASESDNIPFGYGTYKATGNVIWYGDFETKEIVEDGGFFAPDITVGYEYYLGIHFILGHGQTELQKIKMSDKDVWVNTGETGNFRGYYEDRNLISEDNGVAGNFQFYSGSNNVVDPYISSFIDVPAYGGLCNLVFEKNYIGNSTTPVKTEFVTSTLPLGYDNFGIFDEDKLKIDTLTEYPIAELGEELNVKTPINTSKSFILSNEDGSIIYNSSNYEVTSNEKILIKLDQSSATNPITEEQELKLVYSSRFYDLNPAVVVYDVLTNQEYGISVEPSRIDTDSFIEAQNRLYDEEFGLSFPYSQNANGEDLIAEIMRHVGGVKVDDFYTGKIKFKLIRDDYDKEAVLSFDESNIISMDSYQRTGSDELYSELKVEYTNKQKNYDTSLVAFQNEGLRVERATNTQSVTQSFLFCTNQALASKIAYREAIPVTTALAKFEFKAFKTLGLEVGDVVKLSWSAYDMETIYLRIQAVDYGTFADNKMSITALQDTFGVQFTSYDGKPSNSGFKPVDFTAKPMALNVLECNKFLSNTENRVLTYGEKPTSTAIKYKLLIDELNAGNGVFTKVATLDNDVVFDDDVFEISTTAFNDLKEFGASQIEQGGNLTLITDGVNQELFAFESKESINGVYTLKNIKRGCCDTKPKNWLAGANIYFISYGNSISVNSTLNEGQNIKLKGLTVTDKDILKSEDASEINFTMSSEQRNKKPIVAANMKVNNTLVNDVITIPESELMSLTWEFRNIEKQTTVKGYFDTVETTNDQTDYQIIIKDSLGVVLVDTITQNNFYTFEETGAYESELNIEVISIKDGYTGFDSHAFRVVRVA